MSKAPMARNDWHVPGYGIPERGELSEMREGLTDLMELLSYARPHDSEGEIAFLRDYLVPRLDDIGAFYEADGFGNLWVYPEADLKPLAPCVLWSCHIDTVHAKGGRQRVQFAADRRTIELSKRKPGRCLGADDGAGVWLLLEMLRAKVPGVYVFHRGEEVGRLGSEWVALHDPDRLQGIDACVAFDRRDFANCITHQMGRRCASDDFALSFGKALRDASNETLRYAPDDTGSFTDSYSYCELVPECCNVSVGYDGEHGPRETLDGLHIWRLRNALLDADFSQLAIVRDHTELETDDWWGGYHSFRSSKGSSSLGISDITEERERMRELVEMFPSAVVDVLCQYGLGVADIMDELTTSELTQALSVSNGAGGWNHD